MDDEDILAGDVEARGMDVGSSFHVQMYEMTKRPRDSFSGLACTLVLFLKVQDVREQTLVCRV